MIFAPLSSPAPWPPSGLGLTGLPRSRSGVPHPGQVIGRSRQRHLDRHFLQSSASELPHPTLLFQYAEDRFNQSLASPIGRAPQRATQLLPHASVHGMPSSASQASAAVQHPRQVRIRYVSIHPLFLQLLQGVQSKETTVGTDLGRSFSAALLHPFHHRQQRRTVGGLLRNPLLDDQLVLAGGQRHRVAQHEALPHFQKTAVWIAPRASSGRCPPGWARHWLSLGWSRSPRVPSAPDPLPAPAPPPG